MFTLSNTRYIARSEIRIVRTWDSSVPSGEEIVRGVGADHFRPLAQRAKRAPITYGRGPGLGEGALILDREIELQPLALIVGVACKTWIGTRNPPNLSLAPFFRCFRSFVIEQPITQGCGQKVMFN